jgi:hypothetical protein
MPGSVRFSPGDGMGLVAEMVGHLDLETPLEHLAHQSRQQPVVARQLDALGSSPVDDLGGPVPHHGILHWPHTSRLAHTRRHRSSIRRRSHHK